MLLVRLGASPPPGPRRLNEAPKRRKTENPDTTWRWFSRRWRRHRGERARRTLPLTEQDLIRAHTLDQRRRGLQESTIDSRRRIVTHFSHWLGQRGLLGATTEDIEMFLDSRKMGRKARYTAISNLHVFYDWTVQTERTSLDPTARVVRPKVRLGLPRPISDSDLHLALAMSSSDIRVMLTLAAYQGMRCIEIARLTRDDILDDRRPPVLIARGKGDRPRIIPLHDETWRALRMLPLPPSGPVLRSPAGQPLPAWKVSAEGNTFLHGIGIDATMHQARHWFGTTLYRTSGKDLLLVRDLMGHSSITTTTVYANPRVLHQTREKAQVACGYRAWSASSCWAVNAS